jgi:hypothetical protein
MDPSVFFQNESGFSCSCKLGLTCWSFSRCTWCSTTSSSLRCRRWPWVRLKPYQSHKTASKQPICFKQCQSHETAWKQPENSLKTAWKQPKNSLKTTYISSNKYQSHKTVSKQPMFQAIPKLYNSQKTANCSWNQLLFYFTPAPRV